MTTRRIFLTTATLLCAAVSLLLTAASSSGHAEPAMGADPLQDQEAWLVRTARIEGAAGNVKEWAAAVQEAAGRIQAQGRLTGMPELVSRTDELNRRVVGAALAAEVLDRPL